MIKFRTDGNPPLLGLGLSSGNLKQLADGHPIKIPNDIPTDYFNELVKQLEVIQKE